MLFGTFSVRSLQLANRVVMAPQSGHTRARAEFIDGHGYSDCPVLTTLSA